MRYVLAFIIILMPACAQAAVIYAATSEDGIRIELTDEPCKLTAVTNTPRRATWTERGKTTEGCWGVMSGMVGAYFDDRTIAVMPKEAFVKVRSL